MQVRNNTIKEHAFMKILVTGGSGFIGKAFIKRYRKTFDIVAPTHGEMDLLNARSIEAMFRQHRFDAVVHLAGVDERSAPSALEADNLIMFKNIQYMSIVHGVKKLLIVGAGADFDRSRPIADFTEDKFGGSIPTDGYGLGWYLVNLLASKDKITTSLRLFDVYGAGSNKPQINRIVAAGSRGKKTIVIDRDKTVSAISVEDVAKVIAAFLRGDYPKGDYNLVSSDKTSYLEIAKSVKRAVRRDGGDIEIRIKNDRPDLEYTAANDKLVATLGIKLTSTANGVKKLYEELKPKRRGAADDGE